MRLMHWLVLIPVAMFGFAFALVPLYNVFCSTTGLNGKTMATAYPAPKTMDETRVVTMEFSTTLNENLPWEFYPKVVTLQVHPGEVIDTSYIVQNLTDHRMTIQAIPSVSPSVAAKHVKKIECFCFQNQALDGHCTKEMPLRFFIDPALPKDVHTVTLSYTLFDISKLQSSGAS